MISFVYFDVGGVVVLDFSGTQKWAEMKHDMGIHKRNEEIFDRLWKRYREEICIDRDVDTLIPIIERECHITLPKEYSMLQDFVNRFEANPSIWPVITKIRKTCKVGLLTNMYPRMFQAIERRKHLPPVSWDAVIDSSIVGYQKPDQELYEVAEKQAKTKKANVLFVENSIEHLSAARDFGWQTFLYDSTNPVESSRKLAQLF